MVAAADPARHEAWKARIEVTPVGVVRGGRQTSEDDFWGDQVSHVELDAERCAARHPRGRADWPLVGIFAQRAKRRPNRIGVTTCRLLGVDGLTVTVEGLDAMEGTPVLDIKPYMAEFDPRGDTFQPEWAHEVMSEYFAPR